MKYVTNLKWKFALGLFFVTCALHLSSSSVVLAGQADVLKVQVVKTDADMYRFSVTVRHSDEGWEHYADRWDVLDEAGTVLGTRVLMHPHDAEQPFTRSMKLSIPMYVKNVIIRARDKKHGYIGKIYEIELPQ